MGSPPLTASPTKYDVPPSPFLKSPPVSPRSTRLLTSTPRRSSATFAPSSIPPILRPLASHPLVQPALERLVVLSSRLPRVPLSSSRSRVVYLFAFVALLALSQLTRAPSSRGKLTNTKVRLPKAGHPISTLDKFCPASSRLWGGGEHIPTVILKANQKIKSALLQRTVSINATNFLSYDHPPVSFGSTKPAKLSDGTPVRAGDRLCGLHRVPSSPTQPNRPWGWKDSYVMFGMATTSERGLYSAPLWFSWLPHKWGGGRVDPSKRSDTRELPMLLVLTPPSASEKEVGQMDQLREQGGEASVLMNVTEYGGVDRFEQRYFALAEEMWRTTTAREKKGHIKVQWFILADDDTFLPDWNSLPARLGQYNSKEDVIVGTLSESVRSVKQFGYFAYGGGGIIISRALMDKMNAPGVMAKCRRKWGKVFGGDQMVSSCAQLASKTSIDMLLRVEPGMHQLDFIGDATGWFETGFSILTLHHWDTWVLLFPEWMMARIGARGSYKDERPGRDAVALLGKAAKVVGGENLARRYLFNNDKVLVTLGYSVSIHAEPLSARDLSQSEHTWFEWDSFHPMRRQRHEGTEKKTYYLQGVEVVDWAGVWRLEHVASDGARVDVIWDARQRYKEPPSQWIW